MRKNLKLKKRAVSLTAAGVMMATTLLTGCGGNATSGASDATTSATTAQDQSETEKPYDGVTISMMMNQGSYATTFSGVFLDICDEIKEKTGITMDIQPVTDFMDVIQVKLATNEIPDIFVHNLPQNVKLFNAQENCVVMNDQPWFERMSSPDTVLYEDGNLYGMPIQSATWFPAIYYNKDILKQAGYEDPHPTTMDELYEICEAIKTNCPDITPLYMMDNDTTRTQLFMTMGLGVALNDQKEVYDKLQSGELKFSDVPEIKRVTEDFKKFYDLGYVNPDHMSTRIDDGVLNMAGGTAAMVIADEWVLQDIVNQNPDLDIGSFVIPFDGKDMAVMGNFVLAMYVNKNGENKDACLAWINEFSKPEYMNRFNTETGTLATFKDCETAKLHPAVAHIYEDYVQKGNAALEFNAYLDDQKALLDSYLFFLYADVISGQSTVDEMWQRWDEKFAEFQKQNGVPGF